MNGKLVVRRYARALYEAAREADALAELDEDMKTLDRLMREVPQLAQFCLSSRKSSRSSKGSLVFIQTALLPYVGELCGRAIEAMHQNDRLEAVPYLATALRHEKDRHLHVTRVEVEAAAQPDSELEQAVNRALEGRISGTVKTRWSVRPELLGGMTFHWNNRMLDVSLKSKLAQLKNALNRNTV